MVTDKFFAIIAEQPPRQATSAVLVGFRRTRRIPAQIASDRAC